MPEKAANTVTNLRQDFTLRILLSAQIGEQQTSTATLARTVGVYPAYIEAVLDGSLLPTEETLEKILEALPSIDYGQKEFMRTALRDDRRQFNGIADKKERFMMEVMAETTIDSTLPGLLSDRFLARSSPFTAEEIESEQGGISRGRISSIKHDVKSVAEEDRVRVHRYRPASIESLARGFRIPENTSLWKLFDDIAHHRISERTFGEIVIEAAEGNLNFGDLLEKLMEEWKESQYGLEQRIGLGQAKISTAIQSNGRVKSRVDRVRNLSRRFGLNPREDHALWRVMRGDKSVESIETIVQEAQRILEGDDEEAKQEVPNMVLNQLIAFSGFVPERMVETMQTVKAKTIREKWTKNPHLNLTRDSARELAVVFVVDDPAVYATSAEWQAQKKLKQDLENVLQRISKVRTPKELLDEALDEIGTAIKEKGEDVVKDRWGKLIKGILELRNETPEEFSSQISYTNPTTGKGIYRKTVNYWRNGAFISTGEVAQAVATLVGFSGEDKERFVRLAVGRPRFYDPEVLTDCIEGRISRREALQTLRTNSGCTQVEFMDRMRGLRRGTLQLWEREGLIYEEQTLNTARAYGVPEADHTRFSKHFERTQKNRLDEQRRGSAEHSPTP